MTTEIYLKLSSEKELKVIINANADYTIEKTLELAKRLQDENFESDETND